MNPYLEHAHQLEAQLLADRRYMHQNAEVGRNLPKTTAYIKQRLTEIGYAPTEPYEGCVTARIGPGGGKTLLLRADIDALPMEEASGLPFACETGDAAHTCGHDMHGAMLLGAAALLKAHEADLDGEVVLLFQPDEEGLTGAKAAIEAGVLDGVDTAMAVHVFPGRLRTDSFYVCEGAAMASQDRFTITIEGHGGHGALPQNTIDPINVGAHIHLALQTILARENDATQPAMVTVGRFTAGNSANNIPQTAVMEGTIRCYSPKVRRFIKQRVGAICSGTATAFRASCRVTFPVETPPNMNDAPTVREMTGYLEAMGANVLSTEPTSKSEDFAFIAEMVPSAYFILGAGGSEARYTFASHHHPSVIFNEDALPTGAAGLAWCAVNWLHNHAT